MKKLARDESNRHTNRSYFFLFPFVLMIALGWGLSGCDNSTGTDKPSTAEIVRAATQQYKAVDAALADGFVKLSPCVESPAGGMGFHYGKQPLIDATVDPELPEILVYDPGTDDKLTLVAVEYLVSAEAWDAAHDGPPMFDGQPFDNYRASDARHGLPFGHYDLHFWVWKDNPNGIYTPFNPNVSCGESQ